MNDTSKKQEFEHQLVVVRMEREKKITKMFSLALHSLWIIAIPVLTLGFLSKSYTPGYEWVALIIAFVVSFGTLAILFRHIQKPMRILEDKFKKIKEQIQNIDESVAKTSE